MRPGIVELKANALRIVPLAILLVPSLWLLATVPVLWRDSDGYNQVTLRPGGMTIVHFPPLYCFAARLPLYLGRIVECLRAGAEKLPGPSFFGAPVLTDSGIFLLVFVQHGLLLASQFNLLRALGVAAMMEVLLALVLAANASFYSFAHCVGAEAFSLCAALWLIAICLRIVQRRSRTRWDWCWLGVSLAAGILSRHINAVLVALLPGAAIFIAICRMLRLRFRRWRPAVRWLRIAGIALLAGAITVAATTATVRLLSREFHVKIRSTLGFTFLWRLNFLQQMPGAERAAFLARLKAQIRDPLAQRLLAAIATAADTDGRWDPILVHRDFHQEVVAADPRNITVQLYATEGELAKTILLSAPAPYVSAVRRDFLSSLAVSPGELARAPFATTLYCFDRLQELPGLEKLQTFRGSEARDVVISARDRPYFRLMNFPFWSALAVWAVLAAISIVLGGRSDDRVLGLSAALVCVALLMTLANCAFTEFLPRYTLPLWNLVLVAIILQLPVALGAIRVQRTADRLLA